MTLYFCKAPDIVVGTHTDDQIWVDPVKAYGLNTYVVCDYGGPAAARKPPPDEMEFEYPDITAKMQADSVKLECRRRIVMKVSEQAQRNITTHVTQIQSKAIMSIGGTPPTPEEQADIDTADAIWAWIGRPDGMQGAADAMISSNDLEWYQDVKWPPWNSAWDAFVARF